MREETKEKLLHGARNDALLDAWTGAHVLTGAGLGWLMDPFWALVILILWEPLEVFLLHPLVLRLTGKLFGYESWRNSISDIVFDAVGVAVGYYVLRAVVEPPFSLW